MKKLLILGLLAVGGCGVTFSLPAPDPLTSAKRDCREWCAFPPPVDLDTCFEVELELWRISLRAGRSREASITESDRSCLSACLFFDFVLREPCLVPCTRCGIAAVNAAYDGH